MPTAPTTLSPTNLEQDGRELIAIGLAIGLCISCVIICVTRRDKKHRPLRVDSAATLRPVAAGPATATEEKGVQTRRHGNAGSARSDDDASGHHTLIGIPEESGEEEAAGAGGGSLMNHAGAPVVGGAAADGDERPRASSARRHRSRHGHGHGHHGHGRHKKHKKKKALTEEQLQSRKKHRRRSSAFRRKTTRAQIVDGDAATELATLSEGAAVNGGYTDAQKARLRDNLLRASGKARNAAAQFGENKRKHKGKKSRLKRRGSLQDPHVAARVKSRRASVGARLEEFKKRMSSKHKAGGTLDGAVAEARRSRQKNGYDPRREARDRARQKLKSAMGKARAASRLSLTSHGSHRLSLTSHGSQRAQPRWAPAGLSDREKLVAFYERVAPEHLKNVETILQRFDGRSEEMWALLEKMYPGEE